MHNVFDLSDFIFYLTCHDWAGLPKKISKQYRTSVGRGNVWFKEFGYTEELVSKVVFADTMWGMSYAELWSHLLRSIFL